MRKWILGIWMIYQAGSSLLAQGELSDNPRIFYRNEKSVGFLLNSNGWGFSGRYAKRLDARKKTIYEIDFVDIKHPKEVKVSNTPYNNRSFVYGKKNLFLNFRGAWGKQKEIFRKVDRGGISIRRYFSVGPDIGILKPIYYEVLNTGSIGTELYITEEKFSTVNNHDNIYGRASFFRGFDELYVMPGVFGRFGLSFEYSTSDVALHALETAVSLDLFPSRMEIMATEKNHFYFLTLTVSYRFGKVVDARGIIDEDELAY